MADAHGQMIQINLRPSPAGKPGASSIEQLHRTPLMWLVGAAMVTGIVALWLPVQLRSAQLKRLNQRIQELTPMKLEVDRIQQYTKSLRAQEAAFKGLAQGQYQWAKRLNTIATLTPDGVWYTELALDQDKGLIIQGSAIGEGGGEMVKIGRLVQDLKADTGFSSAVTDIQIESIKRFQDKEVEIVQFTLTCELAKEPAS